jgi:hypothetical protein
MSSGLPLKADIARYSRHVSKVPLAEVAASFDYLVGGGEERGWDRQAERLGGLEVYDQLKLSREIG